MAISKDEINTFSRQFSEALNQGIPLSRILPNLAEQQSNAELRAILEEVTRDVFAGHTLSGGFAKYPDVFDERFIVTLRYGEFYGIVDETMMRYAEPERV